MKKVLFILAMLFSPNLFAATLTANTVPYICQGGTNPQLCNSNMTTDSNGNLTSGGLGQWQPKNIGTSYQAATDGFVFLWCSGNESYTVAQIATDSNSSPTT